MVQLNQVYIYEMCWTLLNTRNDGEPSVHSVSQQVFKGLHKRLPLTNSVSTSQGSRERHELLKMSSLVFLRILLWLSDSGGEIQISLFLINAFLLWLHKQWRWGKVMQRHRWVQSFVFKFPSVPSEFAFENGCGFIRWKRGWELKCLGLRSFAKLWPCWHVLFSYI